MMLTSSKKGYNAGTFTAEVKSEGNQNNARRERGIMQLSLNVYKKR